MNRITSNMLRAGRAMAEWTQADLAEKANLSLPTIKRIERAPGSISVNLDTYEALIEAFAARRIEFLFKGGHGVLRRAGPGKSGA